MNRALQEYIIHGAKTTIPFHLAVLNNKNFLKGIVTTSFIKSNEILKCVKDYTQEKKKELSKEQKIILVTTAISKYKENKNQYEDSKPSTWVTTGRQELMQDAEQQ